MNAYITVSAIDFDKSIYSAAPLVFKKLSEKPNPGLAVKFLNKLGMDGLPIVLNVLNSLSEADKNELAVIGINSFNEKIVSMVNKALREHSLADAVSFREIFAESSEGKIEIVISGLELDYAQLVGNKPAAGKLNTGGHGWFSGLLGGARKALEGSVLRVLNSQEVKARILSFAESRLEKSGIYIKLNDFYIDRSSAIATCSAPLGSAQFELPEELEDRVITAAAEYFKKIGAMQQ